MKVKVYSSPFCFWCSMLKNFLRENNVEFKDVNVQEDHEAAIEDRENWPEWRAGNRNRRQNNNRF